MINQIYRIPILETHGATLFCFGDLQWGMPGFDEESWNNFRDEFKATKNAWALGLGDYGDALRPTMRHILSSAMAKDGSAKQQLDDQYRRTHDALINKMDFLEGKLIGLHNGHHCWDFIDGTNSDQRLASALKAPYLGWMASTRLILSSTSRIARMEKGETGGNGYAYTIVSMHGTGGGRHTSTDVAFLEKNIVPGFGADHYVKGHSCKSHATEPMERREVRRVGPAGMITRLVMCLGVGGFHQGYTNGWESSYVEQSGFTPQPIGWGVINFKLGCSASAAREQGLNVKTQFLNVTHKNHHGSKYWVRGQDSNL